MIKAVIIEDEINGRKNLKNLLATYCPTVEVIAEGGSIEEGLRLLNDSDLTIDVAFLDISLPDGLVFQLLNQLEDINFEIIFVTAFDKYAINACEYGSIGYVLKPIDPDKLKESVQRIHTVRAAKMPQRLEVFKQHYSNPNSFEKMSVSAIDGIYFLALKDITRFEAEDNYTHIFLNGGDKITASKTIKQYESILLPVNFYRVHKRHVINLNYMKKFVRGDGGYLMMDDGKKIEISRRRRPVFMDLLKRLQEEI